ncbi:SDR family oxidoreductase [Caballeronia sp. LZ035]|uniref:SDR family NAD(P)-dependent oxidoreductase n=1 Tax=Caballeronia sp. LZ035 TaxID=3038568 RepID=UPI0028599847|nr:SDR family oxidoreductase [Caballeronia sp. LZ035]MDR5761360.1 SDR family oxidoreductase [Caballeronia sp. LZ035]
MSVRAAGALLLRPSSAAISAATALIVGNPLIGFICGYLYTRLFLQGAFVRSYHGSLRETIQEVLSKPDHSVSPPIGEPSVPSEQDRESAQRILDAVPADKASDVLPTLARLATEYEALRSAMPFGIERTLRMRGVAARMKWLGLAAVPFVRQLSQSASPGERLAALKFLQMKFDPAYIDWLAERIVKEAVFIGYQAASALQARAQAAGRLEAQQIKTAVRKMLEGDAADDRANINISSQIGHVGAPERSVYCMTKHAMEGLTKAAAIEFAPRIRVNTVAPTFVDTPMTQPFFENEHFRNWVFDRIPMGRLLQGEQVAAAVLYPASPAVAMITGTSLRIDGGWTA